MDNQEIVDRINLVHAGITKLCEGFEISIVFNKKTGEMLYVDNKTGLHAKALKERKGE